MWGSLSHGSAMIESRHDAMTVCVIACWARHHPPIHYINCCKLSWASQTQTHRLSWVCYSLSQVALKALADMSKKSGEGAKLILELKRGGMNPDLVSRVEASRATVEAQHAYVDYYANMKVINPTNYYTEMNEHSEQILAHFDKQAKYAKAIVSVTKREDAPKVEKKPKKQQ